MAMNNIASSMTYMTYGLDLSVPSFSAWLCVLITILQCDDAIASFQ